MFSKVALVADRDDRQEEDITAEVCRIFAPAITQAKQNHWVENAYQDGFGQKQTLSFLLLIIPTIQQGALESLLLEAISEDHMTARSLRAVQRLWKKSDLMRNAILDKPA